MKGVGRRKNRRKGERYKRERPFSHLKKRKREQSQQVRLRTKVQSGRTTRVSKQAEEKRKIE